VHQNDVDAVLALNALVDSTQDLMHDLLPKVTAGRNSCQTLMQEISTFIDGALAEDESPKPRKLWRRRD
jgi:hypothetical protein